MIDNVCEGRKDVFSWKPNKIISATKAFRVLCRNFCSSPEEYEKEYTVLKGTGRRQVGQE
jgi:hypothetical protein